MTLDNVSVTQLMFSVEECYWVSVLCNCSGLDNKGIFHHNVFLSFTLENPIFEDLKNNIIKEFYKKVNQKD